MVLPIEERMAGELAIAARQIAAAIELLDAGATVPFIARYRKEKTGGLTDVQLRQLEERLVYLRELDARRQAIIESISRQNKMTPALMAAIEAAKDKAGLEDIYLPYRPKRRTRAALATEAGLGRLADDILADPGRDLLELAAGYLREPFVTGEGENPGVPDARAALEGARQILMERFSEDAALVGRLRSYLERHGMIESSVVPGKEQEGARFADYFSHSEPASSIAMHRVLALLRGRREEILMLKVRLDSEEQRVRPDSLPNPCEAEMAAHFHIEDHKRPSDRWLFDTVRLAWRVKLLPHLETELLSSLRERAEEQAIAVFARNTKSLLMAAPAGARTTMGLDPGIRTGVKVAVVDQTGKVVDTCTVYPHPPRNDWAGSLDTLFGLVKKHGVELVAIGNGTASRETERLARDLQEKCGDKRPEKMVVSEAGASVYSASEYAALELPELDVTLRGAVSIARRLQDPLAELVKIEPRSIGVGQYQHDVAQTKLGRSLDATVEDCVNAVGVDVNMASVPLLARVSGLTESIARNIVRYRDEHGRFGCRNELLAVPRLGGKTFEQAAGFLRISGGDNPLDASAVHPESYPLVHAMAADLGLPIEDLLGNSRAISRIRPEKYVSGAFGLPTVSDILAELDRPGRDPRPEFVSARFREDVEKIGDLVPDMVLEGVVTNVTAFGAFVDVGVHQDGLVHISEMSDRFVSDPHQVVKTGQIVRVRVLETDTKRNRIQLSMRMNGGAKAAKQDAKTAAKGRADSGRGRKDGQKPQGALAQAFSRLRGRLQ